MFDRFASQDDRDCASARERLIVTSSTLREPHSSLALGDSVSELVLGPEVDLHDAWLWLGGHATQAPYAIAENRWPTKCHLVREEDAGVTYPVRHSVAKPAHGLGAVAVGAGHANFS